MHCMNINYDLLLGENTHELIMLSLIVIKYAVLLFYVNNSLALSSFVSFVTITCFAVAAMTCVRSDFS